MLMRAEDAPNLVELFFAQAQARGDAPFLFARDKSGWTSRSWRETADAVASFAAALRALGVGRGDRVMLVAENRPEWLIADLGIMAAGAVTVPAYTTNTERDHLHILTDSGASAVVVSGPRLAVPLIAALREAPDCRHLIAMDPLIAADGDGEGPARHSMPALIERHRADVAAVRAEVKAGRDDLACLIYTSGTHGLPKGVRYHHGAILRNIAGARAIVIEDFGEEAERFLSFLPLSHAFEHTAGQFLPIGLGAEIHYAEGLEKLASNIAEVRPTIMIVVPRLFELLRGRLLKTIEKQGAAATHLLRLALYLDRQRGEAGWLPPWLWPLDLALERTLRPRVRERFGGRLKALVSGGAPLSPEVAGFFRALGLLILQGYGQTECGPVASCNRPSRGVKLGTVGPPIAGCEIRIAHDGEILVRGENVMLGYWRNEEETARTLAGGWLHTGDIGVLDRDGHLCITDRKKDIIVNDKGENIAPQRVEGMLTLQPEIAQAMVQGDRRPHLVGLVVPDRDWAAGWAAARGVAAEPRALARDPAFLKAINEAVDRVNRQLAPAEKVRRVLVADEPFSVENGELTPSLKVRRHKLRQVYGERLDALYG